MATGITAPMGADTNMAGAKSPVTPTRDLPPVWGPLTAHDARATGEFYRYYHPFQVLYDRQPAWVDLHDAAAVEAHVPAASPDRALTALCQLVAVKLRVRRAMLFFFDAGHGYVLAEATRSLSLRRESVHDPGDGLWLGHSVIPKGFSVCEHTVNLTTNASDATASSASHAHIIHDLQNDARFGRRPYVTKGPRARFYAGVPITTPTGINIGALCALDGETREGLSTTEVDFLTDMSATVMDHLEALRARAEHKRGMQMVAGLSAFVQGTAVASLAPPVAEVLPASTSPPTPSTTTSSAHDELCYASNFSEDVAGHVGKAVSPETNAEGMGRVHERVNGRNSHTASSEIQQPTSTDARPDQRSSTDETESPPHRSFSLAAGIVQKALDLDGVLFFDTSVSTFGGLADESLHAATLVRSGSDADSSVTADELDVGETQPAKLANGSSAADAGVCSLLAASYADESSTQRGLLTQRAVRALCRRYPRGHIWTLTHEDAPVAEAGLGHSTFLDSRKSTAKRHPGSRRKSQYEEMAQLIPGVQSLAFVPIRNITANEWRAVAVLYSFTPHRTFSFEGELSFMAAFGDILIAELARTETFVALQARSAFTSSLSHELRTPLHGILGTVEQLYEEPDPAAATEMFSQIEACGRSLLDMMNHLLDISEIDEARGQSNGEATVEVSDRDNAAPLAKATLHDKITSTTRPVALDLITTEAVERGIVLYRDTLSAEELRDPRVTTTLRITPSPEADWTVPIHEGAWKRICTNLLSNALKFTESGHVSVTLTLDNMRKNNGGITAILCVQDSGRGMRKEYLAHSLFRPFTQENTFEHGAGLGLNIVAQLVRSMGGTIDVESHVGTGTKINVAVPLELANAAGLPRRLNDVSCLGSPTALLLGNWPCQESTLTKQGRPRVGFGVQQTLREVGIEVLRFRLAEDATFVVLFEDDLLSIHDDAIHYQSPTACAETFPLAGEAIMLICKTHASARKLEALYGQQSHRISFVPEPYSPAQVADAVDACTAPRDGPRARDALMNGHATPRPLPHRPPISHSKTAGDNPLSPALFEPNGTSYMDTQQTCEHQCTRQHAPVRTNPTLNDRATPKHDGRPLRVLIVDDNDINLRLLATYCKKQGHHSTTAKDGLQAVQHYDKSLTIRPQVILMDINMPIMNGFDATQKIRKLERKLDLEPALIIALTGLSSTAARQQAFASGIDMFLSKPVKLRELSEVIGGRFTME